MSLIEYGAYRMGPCSNSVNVPDVGDIVAGVSATTVDHDREQLVNCVLS